MDMICNLHTHTFRCNHASGTERGYVEEALKGGLETLGFADHSPYYFPEGYYSGYRMRPELQEDYVRILEGLEKEYKGDIEILIGYEAEYYPAYFEEALKMFKRYRVDYLILGQHFLDNEMGARYSGYRGDDESMLRDYVNQVCEGMDTGLFTYLAHPDLVAYTGDPAVYEHHYTKLIECAKKNKMPLEINMLGIRDRRHYPSEKFFELCGKLGAEVCVGSDAHSVDVTVDRPSWKRAMEIVEKYGLKLNLKPEIKPVDL